LPIAPPCLAGSVLKDPAKHSPRVRAGELARRTCDCLEHVTQEAVELLLVGHLEELHRKLHLLHLSERDLELAAQAERHFPELVLTAFELGAIQVVHESSEA
jgi:hypothetical protein